MTDTSRTYPRRIACGDSPPEIERVTSADRDGKLHDLVLFSHDIDAVAARNEACGVRYALGNGERA